MNKDQSYGGLIFVVSVLIFIGYIVIAIFNPGFLRLVIDIVVSLAVLGILGITGWIGYTMLTTPPPAPLEAEIGSQTTASTVTGTTSASKQPKADD